MCGISGVVGLKAGSAVSVELNHIRHRGPDGEGVRVVDLTWGAVALGMTRLAIVDTQPIAVPFHFPYLKIAIAFNGELYNWRALRVELSDGQPWMTECDAEVIARAWRQWGPAALQRFNGMFAIAIVDELHDSLTLIRDRAGEKPLYYAPCPGGVAFASEIKALALPAFHEVACADLELFEFDCLEATPFRGVMRLQPGHFISIERAEDLARLSQVEWWSFPAGEMRHSNYAVACEELRETLIDAVRLRASAERPVTAYVSGGLDSAIIQAIAPMNQVYCVTFDGADDVMIDARRAAPNVSVVPVSFALSEAVEVLPQIAWHLDTPATWSALAHWFLAQRLARDGFRVVLSGEGADELFGGYSRYRILWWLDRLRADANLSTYRPYADYMLGDELSLLVRMLDRSRGKAYVRAVEVIRRFASAGSLADRMMRVDWHTTMQCLLRMGDKMTGAFGLENRSPFFDHRIIELAASMPIEWKIDARESKRILRDVARSLGVAGAIVNSTAKRGLFVPWARWQRHGAPDRAIRVRDDRAEFIRDALAAWRAVWAAHGAIMMNDDRTLAAVEPESLLAKVSA